MKKLLFPILFILAITSCRKQEIITSPQTDIESIYGIGAKVHSNPDGTFSIIKKTNTANYRIQQECSPATQLFDTVTNGLVWFGWNPGVSWTELHVNGTTNYCWATYSLCGVGVPEDQIACGLGTWFVRSYPLYPDTTIYCDSKIMSYYNPCDYVPIPTHGHHGHGH